MLIFLLDDLFLFSSQSILPPKLAEYQRLRCRVAFHALQFRPEILALGHLMVERFENLLAQFICHLCIMNSKIDVDIVSFVLKEVQNRYMLYCFNFSVALISINFAPNTEGFILLIIVCSPSHPREAIQSLYKIEAYSNVTKSIPTAPMPNQQIWHSIHTTAE